MTSRNLFSYLQKATLLLSLGAFSVTGTTHAQSISDFFKNITKKGSSQSGSSLTNSEITSGLKQALEIGAQTASKQLSQKDGFFKDAAVKILMPPEAQKVATTLRSIGMGDLVDEAILSMNRAAEDAAMKAAPIFVNAIKGITIQDGLQILQGENDAATQYLKGKTTASLTEAFRPVIEKSLEKVNATKLWRKVFETYNQIPFIPEKINPDLTGYVTEQAIKGVFTKIADEERDIRTNASSRTTDLLKKVFAN